MRGAARPPENCRQLSSSAAVTPWREGIGATCQCRANSRIAGSSRNSSESASLYAAPAGVSPLYSVSAIVPPSPSGSTMNASTRDVGLDAAKPTSTPSSDSSQSYRRNCARTAGSAIAA